MSPNGGDVQLDDGMAEAQEGRLLTRVHCTRERNRALVRRKKAAFIAEHDRLFCEACSFDFVGRYGVRGQGFIECHHTRPLAEVTPGEKTRLVDLARLCANCHRMVHAKSPWLTMSELRAILNVCVSPAQTEGVPRAQTLD